MSPYQLHLFGARPLFSPRALKQYLDERKAIPVPDEEARMARLRDWLDALQEKVKHLDESGLEQKFNSLVLCEVLGYVLFPDKGCSAWPKPLSKVTKLGKKPDVILGSFGEETVIHAVLELKKPGVDLDAPQPRENPLSPVEQAFEYGEGILGVRWVLVSDMRVIRLYSVDSRTEVETFKLEACCQPNGHESFRSLYGLLSHENLVEGGRESSASRLFDKSHERQLRLRDSFYDVYYEIRADLYSAIQEAAIASGHTVNKAAALEATQRLLDRLLFLFYCEHHPNELIPRGTFSSVVEAAATLPGPNPHKVYDALKELFKEVDKGSSPASGIKLSGYNGELFKPHPVIDVIDLPDDLHRKDYSVSNDGQLRRVRGVWGLHSFDFWQELNEHLLGHIFEESLSDLVEMVSSTPVALEDKLKERKQHGIYFTHQLLAEFLTRSALRRHIDENAPRPNGESTSQDREEEAKNYQRRFDYLQTLKIADFACGSGAFLVSAYNVLLESFLQTEQRLFTLGSEERHGQLDWLALDADEKRKSLLRDCLYGQDLLPQAIEIAKLALWLRSARKGEKVLDLSSNLVCGNSLDTASTFSRLATHLGEYDVVLGNPPWGGDVDPSVFSLACSTLGLDSTISWDTWELFLLLSLAALKEGGRLALVLPDTFFSPDKSRTRELLVQQAQLEKVYNLGPDWFGPKVRMATIIVQARKGQALQSDYFGLLLMGDLRRAALAGSVPLTQIDATLASPIPQARSNDGNNFEIEVFRSADDDAVMSHMCANSLTLAEMCDRARGEEMAKSGLLWVCPGCNTATVPGAKAKGGDYKPKSCPGCELKLTAGNVGVRNLVVSAKPEDRPTALFIDGDDINHRYQVVTPTRFLLLDEPHWTYKPAELYASPKLLIRQAGVGVWAILDETDARCPQSVYLYRLKKQRTDEGYDPRYVLACLLSRTMAYYSVKRFGEGDPAKAHVKLTHARLEDFPIPRVDFADAVQRKQHDSIAQNVELMLKGTASAKGAEDYAVEVALRSLWGLGPEEGLRVNEQLKLLPPSQLLAEMFDNSD